MTDLMCELAVKDLSHVRNVYQCSNKISLSFFFGTLILWGGFLVLTSFLRGIIPNKFVYQMKADLQNWVGATL